MSPILVLALILILILIILHLVPISPLVVVSLRLEFRLAKLALISPHEATLRSPNWSW